MLLCRQMQRYVLKHWQSQCHTTHPDISEAFVNRPDGGVEPFPLGASDSASKPHRPRLSDLLGQQFQQRDRVVPAEAGVGDALAVYELPAGPEVLTACHQVRLAMAPMIRR